MFEFIKTAFRTFIFDPLAGGNGKIQTSEYAQWVMLIMIIAASYREGTSTEQVYPDIYWTMLFTAVIAIAGLKIYFKKPEPKEDAPK
jgi:hypothetical protein